jgi:TolA-binding protein
MGKLDGGDWESAETDLRHAYEDSSAYRDIALMGWALSLERRNAYDQAIELLEKFRAEFPASSLLPEVNVRLASLSLRRSNPQRTLSLLAETKPTTRTRQEYALLGPEASMRLGAYEQAQIGFEQFVQQFPDSRYARRARFGAGSALVKRGDFSAAQELFDSLGVGTDSLAYRALYESGVLALLQDRTIDAEQRFTTLTERSPYDTYAEQANFQLGMTNYRAKHFREARRYFQLAARMFPESNTRARSYRMLGETNLALGDFSNAQFCFSQVRHLNAPDELLAPAMYQEGVCLYHLGRFKSSAQMLADVLSKYPRDPYAPEGYVWMGEALYQDYRFAEAEHAYSEALRLFPANAKRAEAAYGVAWSLFEQKKFAQSAAAFDRFASDYPSSGHLLDAALRKADCYFFLGQYDKSSTLYADLASTKTDNRTVEYAAFQLAMSYLQRGESARGIAQLREFLTSHPASIYNEVVQFNIGWEYFSKEQYALALPELLTVMERYPASQLMPRVLFNMGDCYYNLKEYDNARAYYQRVIKEYPQSLLVSDALNGLQFTYERQGRPAGALAEIDTLLSTQSTQPTGDLLMRKGDILFGQGDFAGAIQEYQRVIATKPARAVAARALHQLGRSYELENNPQRAITFYAQVPTDYPDADVAPASLLALGMAEIKMKQFREAANVLGAFSRRYPDSPLLSEAAYYHALALASSGDNAGASTGFRVLLEQFPNDVFADRGRLQIAQLLRERKEYRAAIDTLTSVLNRRSDDIAAEALVLIGQNFFAMKKYTDALQAFNDVLRQYTDFPLMTERARMGLGESYEKLRDRKQARAAYEVVARTAVDPALKKDAQDRLRRLRK